MAGRVEALSPILTWEGPGEVPNFCPQGCGGITEDPYGGPCQACWDAVPKASAGRDIDDDPYDGEDADPRCTICNGEVWVECDDPIQCCDPRCDGELHPDPACGGTGLHEHQVIF
jgi:hypothetical protein